MLDQNTLLRGPTVVFRQSRCWRILRRRWQIDDRRKWERSACVETCLGIRVRKRRSLAEIKQLCKRERRQEKSIILTCTENHDGLSPNLFALLITLGCLDTESSSSTQKTLDILRIKTFVELCFVSPGIKMNVGNVLRVSSREVERCSLHESKVTIFACCRTSGLIRIIFTRTPRSETYDKRIHRAETHT